MNSNRHPRWLKSLYTHRAMLKRVLVWGFAILVVSLLTFAILKVDWADVLLALKDLPMSAMYWAAGFSALTYFVYSCVRSEEHTSELQSRPPLVCRLLLEKKRKQK